MIGDVIRCNWTTSMPFQDFAWSGMEQIRSPQNASTTVETLLMEQKKCAPFLDVISSASVRQSYSATPNMGAPRLIACPAKFARLSAKPGGLEILVMPIRPSMSRCTRDRTHQSINQSQNAGERLGCHSSARSSSSGAERDGSTEAV